MGLVTAGATFVLVLAGPAVGQVTSRVSVSSGGKQGLNASGSPSISADGHYVAFWSGAGNLVDGDTNACEDALVRDRWSGTTERVSVASTGTQGNHSSGLPSISADGRFVAFSSSATNLVNGDTNGEDDVFVHDRQSGTTERISVDSSGVEGNDFSNYPSISADGRYVAFESDASNLVGGDTNGHSDIFVHDRQSATTERVNVDSVGTQANDPSSDPSISADGRFVAFASDASNLVGGDTNGSPDIFVHDRQSGTTERVSVDSVGTQANHISNAPSISGDARSVAFCSRATNLVGGDTNGTWDIFVHDRQSGSTERVTISSAGTQANEYSEAPSISADGRYVAFMSYADNLVGGDTNGVFDVFVHDRQSGATERASVATGGVQADGPSGFHGLAISSSGRHVSFESYATNLVGGDTNGCDDVFLRGRGTGFGTKYCTANPNSTGAPADLSADGSMSSSAGYLWLASMPVPNQNGIFFHGSYQVQLPFGNGYLCTTGGNVHGAVVLGAGNVATYTYDNSDAKHSLAAFVGTTRNFQHWFRDPAGGGAFFNLSDAISIAIAP
jgi:Tol biopolymer transport system component